MTDELARLKRAGDRKGRADREFRAALTAAVDAHGFAQAGHVIGWSRQRVRAQVKTWTAEKGDRKP